MRLGQSTIAKYCMEGVSELWDDVSTVEPKELCPATVRVHAFFFIRNLAKGLVLKVPYYPTSFYQILVLKVP